MELKLDFEELYISGTGDIELQSKTVVPTKIEQVIIADEDYTALSKVIVEAIPNEYQDITVVTATADKVLQGYVFVGADGNTLQGEVPIIESAEVLLSSNIAEYTIPNGYHDGNGRVRIELEELTANPTKETQEITASENKVLSKVTVLPIPDDYVNKDEVPKPTLNAPTISLNANGGYLNVTDYKNGNFTEAYRLYLNGEEKATFTSEEIVMTEYGITETDEIAVDCTAELFNTSPLSNMTKWSDLMDGTIGLTYNTSNIACTGWGTADRTKDIVIASIFNDVLIQRIGKKAFSYDDNAIKITVPNSITYFYSNAFNSVKNKNIVFGANKCTFDGTQFADCTDTTLDFRKATGVATIASKPNVSQIIVPDNLYDEWITATNWSAVASIIIRATDYEAQGGAV